MKLMYHDEEKFLRYAQNEKEPEDSLETLIAKHEACCEKLKLLRGKIQKENESRNTDILDEEDVAVVNNEKSEQSDLDGSLSLACAEFNIVNYIDSLEEKIDVKIYYINQKEKIS